MTLKLTSPPESYNNPQRVETAMLSILFPGRMDLKIATLPDCKDPCDFVMKYGGKAFEDVVAKAENVIDYKFRQLVELQSDGPAGSASAIRKAIGFFGALIGRSQYLQGAAVDPLIRGQIYLRLETLSGLHVAEVRAMVDAAAKKECAAYAAAEAKAPFKFPIPGTDRTGFEASDFGATSLNDEKKRNTLDLLDAIEESERWDAP